LVTLKHQKIMNYKCVNSFRSVKSQSFSHGQIVDNITYSSLPHNERRNFVPEHENNALRNAFFPSYNDGVDPYDINKYE
jgi:hypothetical protein